MERSVNDGTLAPKIQLDAREKMLARRAHFKLEQAREFMNTRDTYRTAKNLKSYDDIVLELVNTIDPRNGYTPLLWCVVHDHADICDLLVTCKAHIEVQEPLKRA